MNPTALAFVGYLLLFLVVLITIPSMRGIYMLTQKRAINDFKPDGSDLGPFASRLCRAHANCYESFPYFGGLLLLALATDQTAVTDPLAFVLIGARLTQAVIHMLSTQPLAVWLRFSCFLVQILIAFFWTIQFITIFSAA